jgi:hypothetical protein
MATVRRDDFWARQHSSFMSRRNRVLAALPREELSRLERYLVAVPNRSRHVLLRAGDPIRHVYFP